MDISLTSTPFPLQIYKYQLRIDETLLETLQKGEKIHKNGFIDQIERCLK